MIAVSLTTVVVMLFFISYAYDRSFQLQIKTRRLLENYAKALDASCIVAFTDPRGVITYVNDKFCEVSGYSRQELIGKTHSILNSGHHSADFFGDMWRTISSKCIWKGEVCNITKKGSLYWVDTTIIPMLDEQSQLEQYVALRYETTQRKVAEQMSIQSAKLASLGEKVRITVMDSGNGIPESIANKLMQPFFTTKEVGKGTGLGLSISKGIIESHGGKFELDRNASHTSFVIEIPTKQKRS